MDNYDQIALTVTDSDGKVEITHKPFLLSDETSKDAYDSELEDEDRIEIIPATSESMDEYGHGHGSELVTLKQEHINAILSGKMLAWSDGEYVTFVVFDDKDRAA